MRRRRTLRIPAPTQEVAHHMITRRSVSISLAAALGSVAFRANAQQDPAQIPMVYRVPGMANAKVRENIVYKTAEGSQLHFDLYTPAKASGATPVVIFVHGTVQTVGVRRWGVFTSYGRAVAAMGMIQPAWLIPNMPTLRPRSRGCFAKV